MNVNIGKSKIPGAGRGVFASKDVKKNEVLETAPVLKIGSGATKDSVLQNYIYDYSKDQSILALGYGSLYNHSSTPNAHYEIETTDLGDCLHFIADRNIKKGEEVYISYGPYYDVLYRK